MGSVWSLLDPLAKSRQLFYAAAMKALNAKTYLVHNILIALAIGLAVLGLILSSTSLVFNQATWGYLNHNDIKQPIVLGIIPTINIAIFFCYLFTYLNFEFYGLKTSIHTTISVVLVLCLVFIGLRFFPDYVLTQSADPAEDFFIKGLRIADKTIITSVCSIFIGFPLSLALAALIKKITRSYFMILRFPIASFVGFIVVAGVPVYFEHLKMIDPYLFLIQAGTAIAQYTVLIILAVIPLYVLRIILGMFRGRVRNTDDDNEDSCVTKGMFKGSPADADLPPPPEDKEPAPAEPMENTVSEKISLEEIKAEMTK